MALVLHTIDPSFVATITLNDQANLNAMSEEMAVEFAATIAHLRTVEGLRAVILTGTGRAFSAGGHLAMLDAKRSKTAEQNRAEMLRFYNSFLCMRELNVPLVAAINGAAIGAGLCLACACDIRIATESTKLGFTFLKLGLHPGMGATYFVPRIVSPSMALELLATAKVIDAQEALRIGIISKVVASHEILGAARAIVDEVLKCGLLATTQLIQNMRGNRTELDQALEREAVYQSINYASAEFAEDLATLKRGQS